MHLSRNEHNKVKACLKSVSLETQCLKLVGLACRRSSSQAKTKDGRPLFLAVWTGLCRGWESGHEMEVARNSFPGGKINQIGRL